MDYTDGIFEAHKVEIINNIEKAIKESNGEFAVLYSDLILKSIFNPDDKALCFIETDIFNHSSISFRYSDIARIKRNYAQYRFSKVFSGNDFSILFDGDPDVVVDGMNKAKFFCENVDFVKLVELTIKYLRNNGFSCKKTLRFHKGGFITIEKRKKFIWF